MVIGRARHRVGLRPDRYAWHRNQWGSITIRALLSVDANQGVSPNWSRATFFVASIAALGRANEISDGTTLWTNTPLIWLALAIGLAAVATFGTNPLKLGRREFVFVVAICLLLNFLQWATVTPCHFIPIQRFDRQVYFNVALLCVAFCSGCVLVGPPNLRWLGLSGMLAGFAVMGGWAIIFSPNPHIDVYEFQDQAATALTEGHDPYDMTFADIYGPPDQMYGAGVIQDGRVMVGYPYMPETLIAVLPATWMRVDIRYTHLAAVLLSAILLPRCGGESPAGKLLGFVAAMLLLTMPRVVAIIEQSYTDLFTVLVLIGTFVCAVHRPRMLFWMLGLLLASKQYVPAMIPLLFLGPATKSDVLKLIGKAILVAVVITLPMALWNWKAFFDSVVLFQIRQPFRPDAISFLTYMGEDFWPKAAVVLVPFSLLIASMALVWWRRRSVRFCAGAAFCYLIFFAFSKQAFSNYYFFVIALMACAIVELGQRRTIA